MSRGEPLPSGRARRAGRTACTTMLVVALGGAWVWPARASEVASSSVAATAVGTTTAAPARAGELVVGAPSIVTATTTPQPALVDVEAVATSSEAGERNRIAVAFGVRPVFGLAGDIAEQGHGLDITLGILFELPHGVAGYVGSLGLPLAEYGVARGEVWTGDLRASVGLVYLQRLVTLGGEGARLELQAGGQAEFLYVDGHWRVPSPCVAATAACEGSTYSADTRRLGARISGGVGVTGGWGRWRLALAGWLGPELASGALDFEGLVTPATRARFEALTAEGRVSGVALVAALHASLGVTFEAPGGER